MPEAERRPDAHSGLREDAHPASSANPNSFRLPERHPGACLGEDATAGHCLDAKANPRAQLDLAAAKVPLRVCVFRRIAGDILWPVAKATDRAQEERAPHWSAANGEPVHLVA